VDAPAETPTRRTPANHAGSISAADSTDSTRGFTLRQTSASCAVFALCRPPMITIASMSGASSTAVFCIEVVAPQSVLKTRISLPRLRSAPTISCTWPIACVVWKTTPMRGMNLSASASAIMFAIVLRYAIGS